MVKLNTHSHLSGPCVALIRNARGRLAIHTAAKKGQAKTLELLIQNMDPDTDLNSLTCSKGFSPLHFAAKEGNLSAVSACMSACVSARVSACVTVCEHAYA